MSLKRLLVKHILLRDVPDEVEHVQSIHPFWYVGRHAHIGSNGGQLVLNNWRRARIGNASGKKTHNHMGIRYVYDQAIVHII